jgi:hypothetical protein
MAPEYVTVYRISSQAVDWMSACAGLVPLIAGIVIIIGKRRFGWRRPGWLAPVFCCTIGLLWFLVGLIKDSQAIASFETGHYSVVEGTVAGFHPMPYGGHDQECFSVRSERFCYSDYDIGPGFHNTASHGGPIRAGIPVRIAYMDSTILRLEVAKDQAISPAQSAATADVAKRLWQGQMENNPVQQRLSIASLFAAICFALWLNFQWRRGMRFWVRPPNRPITQYVFRVFFGLSLISLLARLVQQLRIHPLTRQNYAATLGLAAIMCCVLASMVGFVFWIGERRVRD